MPDISAATVAATFTSTCVARFEVPSTITTDRGRQFESCLFSALTTLLGSQRIRTTSYHPASNGMVERFHRQLKAALKAHPNLTSWTEVLPVVLLGLRSVFKPDLGCTVAELVYGTTLRLPGEFLVSPKATPPPDPADYVSRLKAIFDQLRPAPPRQPSSSRLYVHDDLATCTHVFVRVDAVRKPLQPPYTGPYQVVSRTSKFFSLIINGKQEQVSIDRLKPAYIEAPAADLTAALVSTPHSVYQPAVPHSAKSVHWAPVLVTHRSCVSPTR
ncbi:uncharacterized protein LOC135387933 [Ornithodoros turicata]|uniref:uncharacterized protein LOC135387933 n=1 Tax=Ornithodoros turicata TaxID=34597 RepID=UPI00313917BC